MTILIDGHVHFYRCFEPRALLDAAAANFGRIASRLGGHREYAAVLMLADWPHQDSLRAVLGATGWSCEAVEGGAAVRARRPGHHELVVISGRKIITEERLEVLALAMAERFDDGKPLGETIDEVRDRGAIAAVSWAPAKWTGKRGAAVAALISRPSGGGPRFFLADNGNRPIFWPRPPLLAAAEERGIPVLAGSDPLPFRSEARRPGSYVFALEGDLAAEEPARDLRRIVLDPATRPAIHGRLQGPLRFLKNQLALRLRRRKSMAAR